MCILQTPWVVAAADSGALLCFEGLANVEAFWGHEGRARAVFEEGHAAQGLSKQGGRSRFYRGWAQFEKKHADLEVTDAALCMMAFGPATCHHTSGTPTCCYKPTLTGKSAQHYHFFLQ